MGFTYATISGMTIAVSDIQVPDQKQPVLEETSTPGRRDRAPVPPRPDHRRRAVQQGGRAVDAGDGRDHAGREELAEPAHGPGRDGDLGRDQGRHPADPPAGRHARPDGRPVGAHHRAADPLELPRGPDRARVLPEHARRAQGSGRHRAAHGGRRLPDPPPGRRGAGRHHHVRRLRHRGRHLVHRGGRQGDRREAGRAHRRPHPAGAGHATRRRAKSWSTATS